LELTVTSPAGTIQLLDAFRKKRNISDYERSDTISELEADEMRALAVRLRADVASWIAATHKHLLPADTGPGQPQHQ
jgi:hypothetical protein